MKKYFFIVLVLAVLFDMVYPPPTVFATADGLDSTSAYPTSLDTTSDACSGETGSTCFDMEDDPSSRDIIHADHFDAHSDIYKDYLGLKYHQGNPFRLAIESGAVEAGHSIQLGIRGPEYSPADRQANVELGLEMISATELHRIGMQVAVARIREKVGNRPVYISFDTDFLDASCAPGTCIPMPGGFTTAQAFELLRGLRGIDLRGFDIVCLVPEYDPGNITAIAAAHLTWEAIALYACNRKID